MSFVVAIDQSTSATKALLFGVAGGLVDKEAREHRQHYPQPGWVEHDAEEIWQNTLVVLRGLIGRHPEAAAAIMGLSVTNQRETIVVFERGTGRPLHRAIVWQCRRTETLCRECVAAGEEAWVRAKTGLKIDPYFSGSKLRWLVENVVGLREKLAAGDALVGTLDTYLIYRLTGGAEFATDSTNASRTLLFDIGRLAWDARLCELWRIPMRALPRVRESFDRFGETDLDGLLPQAVPICGVMGDSQAALFAHGCFSPGDAKVTFGTGSSILLNIGSELRWSERGVITALAWVRDGRPVYAFEGIIVSAASTLNWLRDQLGLIESLDAVEALATSVPDNGGVYLVPAFTGLGFPHWAPSARATLTGLSPHSDRRHVVRAALESIAFQLRDAFDALREDAPEPLRLLQCDGGPTANRFLMQFTADLTGADLQVAAAPDCSALGAIFAGLLGLGMVASPAELLALRPASVTYHPVAPDELIVRLVAAWRHAVRQTTLAVG